MIFISSPYSSPYMEIIADRVKKTAIYSSHLIQLGLIPVSPILFGEKILEYIKLPNDFNFWGKLSLEYLKCCTEMRVLILDGWESSSGVNAEIRHAKELGIPIKYIDITISNDKKYLFNEKLKLI